MGKKTIIEIPHQDIHENEAAPEQPVDLEEPFVVEEHNTDVIMPDDPFESPPDEPPAPGEGP